MRYVQDGFNTGGICARAAITGIAVAGLLFGGCRKERAGIPGVAPVAETQPVASAGDAADDPCIWLNADDPAASRVIGTDKNRDTGGLYVYGLDGTQRGFAPRPGVNNVDMRTVEVNGEAIALVGASCRPETALVFYRFDPATDELRPCGTVRTRMNEPYGFCMYQSSTGDVYAVAAGTDGLLEQWRVRFNTAGAVEGVLACSFRVGSKAEGCVADDRRGLLYVAEEEHGIWRYGAEPSAAKERILVDKVGTGGHLTADVEGLALYDPPEGDGYLVASSQGNNTFVLYGIDGNNPYVGTFAVVDNREREIDGVSDTDGIDVAAVPLGGAFVRGMLVVQDGDNRPGNQNFKLVSWADVERVALR